MHTATTLKEDLITILRSKGKHVLRQQNTLTNRSRHEKGTKNGLLSGMECLSRTCIAIARGESMSVDVFSSWQACGHFGFDYTSW